MKLFVVYVASLTAAASAHDGIVWSSVGDVANFRLSEAIETASAERPLAIFLLEQFTLPDFGKYANVYDQKQAAIAQRPLINALRSAKSYDDFAYKSSMEDVSLSREGVHVFRAEDLVDLDGQLTSLLKSLESHKYTGVILNSGAFERLEVARRSKRDTIEPLVLASMTNGTTNISDCAMALDQLRVKVSLKGMSDAIYCLYPDNSTDNLGMYMRDCNVGYTCGDKCTGEEKQTVYKSTFQISFIGGDLCDPTAYNKPPQPSVSISGVTLQFTYQSILNQNWWRLAEVSIVSMDSQGFTKPALNAALYGVSDAYITTIYYNSWQCPMTDQIHSVAQQGDSTNAYVAFQFVNFIAQPFGWSQMGNAENHTIPYTTLFNAQNPRQIDTCVPVFSIADYMSFFIIFIMLVFFFFILSLLNDLKTNDRYDDVKQKPLVITVKGE